jgi:hypothetical protein
MGGRKWPDGLPAVTGKGWFIPVVVAGYREDQLIIFCQL